MVTNLQLIKTFLAKDVLQVPAVIPLSGVTGYYICGVKCAGIATVTSMIDLGLKYFKITDSYYLTSSTLGGVFGHNMATPFIEKYKIFIAALSCETQKTLNTDPVTSPEIGMKIEYLSKVMSVCAGSLGILISQSMGKIEDWLVGRYQNIDTKATNCINDLQAQELIQDNIENPEL